MVELDFYCIFAPEISPVNGTGDSPLYQYRAQKQVRSFNKTDLEKREFDSEIIDNVPAGEGARSKALEKEKEYSIKYKDEIEKKYHKRP